MSSRDLSAGLEAELTATLVRPFFLFECVVDSTTLRYCTLPRNVSWNSQTWLGNGFLRSIGRARESDRVGAEGAEVYLAGEPSALVALALDEFRQNKAATIYFGLLNSSWAVIADPYALYSGVVDSVELQDSVEQAVIRITLENKMINQNKAAGLRYTAEAQESMFAGDLGFEYMLQLQDWSGYWGKKRRAKKGKRNRRNVNVS
jgi:hypothetical protein